MDYVVRCFELLLQLDPSLNLVGQCIAGTGMVQINVEVKCDKTPPRLNIVDVLQPPEDLTDITGQAQISSTVLTMC